MPEKYKVIKIKCDPGKTDLLIAGFAGLGINSFLEEEDGFQVYLKYTDPVNQKILQHLKLMGGKGILEYAISGIEEKNWNAEWEKSYDPVIIKDQCLIRSTFHDLEKPYPLEIIINPKMSFGTGHHDTTSLMIEYQLEIDHYKNDVIDAGCGTGILSIVAEKSGAREIISFDTDPQACENTLENIQLNKCKQIRVFRGDASIIPDSARCNIVLANINRNIILDDMPLYKKWLKPQGFLIVSGFYDDDRELVFSAAEKYHLELLSIKTRNKWVAMVFQKKSQ